MVLGAVLWDYLREGPTFLKFVTTGEPIDSFFDIILGTIVAFLFIVIDRILEKKFEWAKKLSQELTERIGRLSIKEIILYAMVSAIGEELFFRGAMQPTIGLIPTALIFGALHGLFEKKLWVWVVLSTIMGLVLGYLVELRGNLSAAVITHFTINYFNLNAMQTPELSEQK